MCLFNREIQGMSCGHQECKNYYMLNKQMSMYGLNQSSSSNTFKPTHTATQKANAPSQSVSQKPTSNISAPQDNGVKRPRPIVADTTAKDSEEPIINKALKTENEEKSEVPTQKSASDTQPLLPKIPEQTQFQQPILGANGTSDKDLLNSILLNNILLPNSQTNGVAKQETTAAQLKNNPNLLLSLLQNPQSNFSIPAQLQPKPATQQMGLNPIFPHLMPSNVGIKNGPMNSTNNPVNLLGGDPSLGMVQDTSTSPNNVNNTTMNVANLINDIKSKSENGLTGDGFLREFQGRILGLLFTQNKMLVDLKEKNDVLQDTLACLINEINTIKNSTKQANKDKATTVSASSLTSHQFMGSNTETVSVEDLITFLYGPSPDFQYQLILKYDLALPLYRERNFKFTVMLTDKNGNVVDNSNRITLTIGLYSSENPPKYIDANTAGNKILKGFIEKDLICGSATFEKIQIKEVTSHFRNGWIFFVVYPKVSNQSGVAGASGTFVNSQKIKPLILEKVVVKAKKAKEKELTSENCEADDNNQQEENQQDESVK